MFVLMGEFKGDYDDFYERPVEAVACSSLEENLVKYWESIKDKSEYIDFRIEEVPFIDHDFNFVNFVLGESKE